MTKFFLACAISLLSAVNYYAQDVDSVQMKIDEIERSLVYQTGTIELESGNAVLKVPKGFRFLNKKQTNYVLTDLWGNPQDNTILGMLVPENTGILGDNSWAFTLSFEEMGYVKDDDAEDIDYDDLLKDQKKETLEQNAERIKQGYESIDFIGWASAPYYDKDKKILHWAKEIKFGDAPINTLNYNLRILGRKGVFMLNAIASMKELPVVKANINQVIGSIELKPGHKYSDYVEESDHVAEWTIGGLVAGKILAKVGFFALILKFWKIIAIAVAGGGAAIWKRIKGRKKEEVPDAETQEVSVTKVDDKE